MEAVKSTNASFLNDWGRNSFESAISHQDGKFIATVEEIMENYEENKIEIQKYLKIKKDACHINPSPIEAFMNEYILPVLKYGMCRMLRKIKEDNSFHRPRSTLNGLDFLSECLYNLNPLHPERKSKWTYIFDLKWVVEFLDKSPRPHYPLSLIWSEEVAAKKIQAFWRGYCDRKKDQIQEVRVFWKSVKNETKEIVP